MHVHIKFILFIQPLDRLWIVQRHIKICSLHSATLQAINCATVISTTLINQQSTCPGSKVIFTCRTTGGSSTTLAWISVDYIGDGRLLYIAELHNQGETRTALADPNTLATLMKNLNVSGQHLLESTLCIIASPHFLSSSVMCSNFATNESATSNFSVYRKWFDLCWIVVVIIYKIQAAENYMMWSSDYRVMYINTLVDDINFVTDLRQN